MTAKLQSLYPWIKLPFIVLAPMRPYAKHLLATEVTKAGGLGFIPNGNDTAGTRKELALAQEIFRASKISTKNYLPIGIGYQIYQESLTEAIQLASDFKPVAVWLFAARENRDYGVWVDAIRKTDPRITIWIQVGNISDLRDVIKFCGTDVVIVMQGIDAGGHGMANGAGIVTLLPEAIDALEGTGIPVLAAGGISEGRSAASALLLGADGVVVGTRFLAATEATTPKGFLQQILDTDDGGIQTRRTRLFDKLRGTGDFPDEYDGRALLNKSIVDMDAGVPEDDMVQSYKAALKDPETGFGSSGRLVSYAGTGVGLVREVKPAAEIIEEIRRDALAIIEKAHQRMTKWRSSNL